ncbi:MAG: CoA-binding protein, partial [Kiloniellales bacterium]
MAEATTAIESRAQRDLAPLLAPESMALVGASARPETPGNSMARMVRVDGYAGRVTAVNPNYREVEGISCVASLAALPAPAEHAVLSVPNAGLEAALDEAIAAGVRAVTIFASCHLDNDREPPLARRLAAKANAAGVLICGGSSMGFYNPSVGLRVATFLSAPGLARGGIAWIAQSGSVFGALAHNDRRLRFSLCVSSGAEHNVTVADYMRYAIEQPETRVVGLFLETVRDPQGFVAALEAAAARGIPVVVLKVGRSARSAAMAMTHTGALAGNDAAYRALFRRYGVIRVDDLDEMAATLALFEQPRRAAPGGLATIHDSGGERELLVDLAEQEGVAFGEIGAATKAALAARLDPGLEPENPLDAWGTGRDFQAVYSDCFSALLADPGIAAGLFLSDPRDDYWYSAACIAAAEAAAAATGKPVAIASNYTLTDDRKEALRLAAAGVPLIKGTRNALRAMKHLLAQRDFAARRRGAPPPPPPP